jgi:hypothetical protein
VVAVSFAVRDGRLKAARIGAGRNLLFCAEWLDQFLEQSAESTESAEDQARPVMVPARRRAR